MIDPNGAPEVSPEEVELMTYDENKRGLWASFHLQGEGRGGNYFPVAHDDWYPNSSHFTLGEYAAYDVTFRKRAMLYYDDVLASP